MININGKQYFGNNINIKNGNISIDGQLITPEEQVITITVTGNIESINADSCETITVSGSVSHIKTMSGDVRCGDVLGSVKTMSGDIHCGEVAGKAETMSGDISKR